MVPAGQRAFSLTARISNAGVVIPGGASLSVRGDIGGTDQLLFSSTNLTNFGFGITDEFEFIFVQQAGSLAAVGQPIGTILVGPGLFNGNGGLPRFTTSFSLTASGNADTFPVPAPGAAMALGVGGLAVLRRRSR
jgi:MYXO-CTERM domain-containing protein